jgi:hypothetical protein
MCMRRFRRFYSVGGVEAIVGDYADIFETMPGPSYIFWSNIMDLSFFSIGEPGIYFGVAIWLKSSLLFFDSLS